MDQISYTYTSYMVQGDRPVLNYDKIMTWYTNLHSCIHKVEKLHFAIAATDELGRKTLAWAQWNTEIFMLEHLFFWSSRVEEDFTKLHESWRKPRNKWETLSQKNGWIILDLFFLWIFLDFLKKNRYLSTMFEVVQRYFRNNTISCSKTREYKIISLQKQKKKRK